jgi:hypothetical protein
MNNEEAQKKGGGPHLLGEELEGRARELRQEISLNAIRAHKIHCLALHDNNTLDSPPSSTPD